MLNSTELPSTALEDIYFSALVVDNNDTNKQGRVKIRCKAIHDGVSDSDLPWAFPQLNISGLDIPQKQKYVWVQFQQGNRYEPVYLGYVLPKNIYSSSILAEDYPDTRGFYDGKNWITLNKKSGKIELRNDVNKIVMDSSGISITSTGELNITVQGNANIESSGVMNLTAPLINCN